jgi:hypothetical protein
MKEGKIDIGLYRHYLDELFKEAIDNSDGTKEGILNYLRSKEIKGLFVKHKEEKRHALSEMQKAFEDHRHWPLDILISHLGLSSKNSPAK